MGKLPEVMLVACRFDQAIDEDIARIPVPRDWHEDRFRQMLEDIGCSGYGHSDDDGPLAKCEVAFEPDDPHKHYVIDTPLFTLRPFWWGDDDDDEIGNLPNFVYKPWDYQLDWYKYPMRGAYANFALKDDDFALMCDTCVRATRHFAKHGDWDVDVDDFPRMSETEAVAWEMRKRLSTAYSKIRRFENLLFDLARQGAISDPAMRAQVLAAIGMTKEEFEDEDERQEEDDD